jgi:hypothetical protein
MASLLLLLLLMLMRWGVVPAADAVSVPSASPHPKS